MRLVPAFVESKKTLGFPVHLLIAFCFPTFLLAAPDITGITPLLGQPGDVITITGSGFALSPGENQVRFGPNRAPVLAAGAQLMVQVPNGQPLGPTNVTVAVAGQTSRALVFNTVLKSKIPLPPNPPV